jgi:ribokinase
VRLAVVGHVEWVDFLDVPRLPGLGEILHARSAWAQPAGGGAMAAYALRSLTGAATFFCAVGDDDRGRLTAEGLRAAGLDVRAVVRCTRAQRRTITHLSDDGERTITVLGDGLIPEGADDLGWPDLAGFDGVCVMGADAEALRAARAARVLVASARAREALLEAGVPVDALVGSADDPFETLDDELVGAARPRYLVRTQGAAGGVWHAADGSASGSWAPAPQPGPQRDTYGCGDAFAAALTAGLAAGAGIQAACDLAAQVGAALLTERAPAVGDLAPLWQHRAGASRDD